ncbi:MAG TPA: PepSY-associated TM helix domain-containing protein [Steroidobacteraceae bacterium]|nr:PepSY-associated TM helix domain-containing protein [Steroidobacteraceae bacterium]
MTIKKFHRLLGLFAAVFWMVQALTGVALTFRQEIDNASVRGPSVPLQTAGLGERIQAIEQGGGKVSSLWVTNFAADRFEIFYTGTAGTDRAMRVDAAGRALRDGPEHGTLANGGLIRMLTPLHTSLLAGPAGKWIIVVSGLLLITNVVLGLKLAWPRAGQWKQVLTLRPTRNAVARFYGLHRTLGLWIAIPLLIVAAAGVLLQFDDDIEDAFGLAHPLPVDAPVGSAVSPARALDIALARFPGSTLTALTMPADGHAWYCVRVHAPGEISRVFGTTTVFVSTADGSILREYPAQAASVGRALYDSIYPIHTGEIGGLGGRLLLLATGIALLVIGVFGIRLWLVRRKPR